MKRFSAILIILLAVSASFGALIPVTNGEFDEGDAFNPSPSQSVPGWVRTGAVNRVANYPVGSMDFWDEQYQFEESHVRFGWSDGGKLWQNATVATLPTIQADTIYTLSVRARVSVDSPTVGIGIELNDATNWEDILTEFFYDTARTDCGIYTI